MSLCCHGEPLSTWCLEGARGIWSPWEEHITINTFTDEAVKIKLFYSLAAVDDDVLGPDAPFEHTHFGMVTATSEKAGGLDAEVGDALFMVVHDTEAVRLQEPLIFSFYFLQDGGGDQNQDSRS